MKSQPRLSPLVEGFFPRRLMQQRQASVSTIASSHDTIRLLLPFVH